MRITVDKKDALWGYISTTLSMSINFIMLPFILLYLSEDEIGMYYIFGSLSTLITFFDFGFNPSFARSISYAWSGVEFIDKEGGSLSYAEEPNYLLLKKLVVTCRVFYFFLAILALFVMGTIGTAYVKHVSPEYSRNLFIIPWLIYVIAMFINLLYDYFSALLRGVGAVKYVNISMVLGRLIQICMCITTLMLGLGLAGVAMAYLAYGIVFRLSAKSFFNRYKEIRGKLENIDYKTKYSDIKKLILTLWPNTWKEGIVTLANYIANQGTTIICSLFFNLYQTGLYSLTNQLVQAIATIAYALYNTYQPALQSAYANHDKKRQKKLFSIVIVSYVFIFVFGMIGLIVLGKPLIRIIKPEYELSISVVIGVGIYQFILKYRNCYATYFSTTNRVIYYKAFLLSSVLGVLLSWMSLSVINIGLAGIIIPQILAQAVYNGWYWSYKAHKEMDIDPMEVTILGFSGIRELIFRKR